MHCIKILVKLLFFLNNLKIYTQKAYQRKRSIEQDDKLRNPPFMIGK